MQLLQFIIVNVACLLLTACLSTTLTGAQMIYDHRSIQQKIDNQYTSLLAYQKIYLNTKRYQNTHVGVITSDHFILLVGQIPNKRLKMEIAYYINQIKKNRQVFNYIETASPSSFLTRISDSWITTKIKSQFLATNQVDASTIKVVTENGNVFLLGTLSREEGKIASVIAKNTIGVQSITKLFSYTQNFFPSPQG